MRDDAFYAAVLRFFATAISSSSVGVAEGPGGPVDDGWRAPTVFQKSSTGALVILTEIDHQNCGLKKMGVMTSSPWTVRLNFYLKYGTQNKSLSII